LFAALPGYQTVEDYGVVVVLRGVEHGFAPQVLYRPDAAGEALGFSKSLAFHPFFVTLLLGREQEAHFPHEGLTRFTIDDEFMVLPAFVCPGASIAVGERPFATLATLMDAGEDTKVGQQALYILQQGRFAGCQAYGAALAVAGDIDRAVALEKRL